MIITSVAIGRSYPKVAERQRKSLEGKFNGQVLHWTDYPEGCPTHEEVPYAFKPFALKFIEREFKHDLLLWLDSAVYAQHNLTPLFDQIRSDGYLFVRNGWSSGHWCTDKQLEAFNLTREQAFEIPHPMACIIGLDITSKVGKKVLDRYYDYHPLFVGDWKNDKKQVSKDSRVLGSRHDQSVLGLIIHDLGLRYTDPSGVISYDITDKSSILLSQGI